MKVPIRYKSSDRYNAGVDVVYDDESKMQYAPFVYASTASGDNGGSEDEEGEDVMVIHSTNEGVLDKTWEEILTAAKAGKTCIIVNSPDEDEVIIRYLLSCYSYESSGSTVYAMSFTQEDAGDVNVLIYSTSDRTGYPEIAGDV